MLSDYAKLVLVRNLICKHNVQSSNQRRNGSHTRTHPPKSSRDFFALFPLPSSFARGCGLPVRLSRSFGFLAPPRSPANGHLFSRLQRLLFVKSCFQTAGCVLSVRNPKLSCGICFFLLQKIRNSHCLLMERGLLSITSLFAWQGNSFPRIVDCESDQDSKPTPARI